jgi:hypothetical protein
MKRFIDAVRNADGPGAADRGELWIKDMRAV